MTEERLPWSAPYDVPEGGALVRQPGFDATWRTLSAGNFSSREIALAWRVTYDVLDAMGVPTGTHEGAGAAGGDDGRGPRGITSVADVEASDRDVPAPDGEFL